MVDTSTSNKRRNLIYVLWADQLKAIVKHFNLPHRASMHHRRMAVLKAWNDGNAEVGVMVFDLLMKEAQL